MDVTQAMALVVNHVDKHSDNKYQNSIVDTEKALKQPVFTLFTAQKYVARYLAFKGEKNKQRVDLLKAVHFILFEIQNNMDQEGYTAEIEQTGPVKLTNNTMFERELDVLAAKYGLKVDSYTTKKKD